MERLSESPPNAAVVSNSRNNYESEQNQVLRPHSTFDSDIRKSNFTAYLKQLSIFTYLKPYLSNNPPSFSLVTPYLTSYAETLFNLNEFLKLNCNDMPDTEHDKEFANRKTEIEYYVNNLEINLLSVFITGLNSSENKWLFREENYMFLLTEVKFIYDFKKRLNILGDQNDFITHYLEYLASKTHAITGRQPIQLPDNRTRPFELTLFVSGFHQDSRNEVQGLISQIRSMNTISMIEHLKPVFDELKSRLNSKDKIQQHITSFMYSLKKRYERKTLLENKIEEKNQENQFALQEQALTFANEYAKYPGLLKKSISAIREMQSEYLIPDDKIYLEKLLSLVETRQQLTVSSHENSDVEYMKLISKVQASLAVTQAKSLGNSVESKAHPKVEPAANSQPANPVVLIPPITGSHQAAFFRPASRVIPSSYSVVGNASPTMSSRNKNNEKEKQRNVSSLPTSDGFSKS